MEDRWWILNPGRLKHELDCLEEAHIPCVQDEAAYRAGIIRLKLTPTIAGKTWNLVVTFPDLFPYFRFEVAAPDEALPYHQNPFQKNLCLIGRSTFYWNVNDNVATLIQEQLEKLYQTASTSNRDEVLGKEQAQAEPFSEYYPFADSMILLDGSWVPPADQTSGTLVIGTLPQPFFKTRPQLVHGVLLEIRGRNNVSLWNVEKPIYQLFSGIKIEGRWIRATAAIPVDDQTTFFDKVRQLDASRASNGAPFQDGHLQIYGVLFPEEVAHREKGLGWVFSCCHHRPHTAGLGKRTLRGPKKEIRTACYFARAGRVGRSDMRARMPELYPLSTKAVSVFGLGCVGAPSVLELARAGVGELRILDHDIVDPGTCSRWPIGLTAAGLKKVHVLQQTIERDYPYTKVIGFDHKIGEPRRGDFREIRDPVVVGRITNGTTLIYDATAEIGVQHFLSKVAHEKGIPYIAVTGSLGGWGGAVVRIDPRRTQGCWLCYRKALDDGTIKQIPVNEKEIQPAGCGDPTFTGTGFDLAEVALWGVRVAVSTLCESQHDAYPRIPWDVLTISFRNEEGQMVTPEFRTYTLNKRPDCPYCA